ncbi:hypothetical protein MF265_05655 [Serratia marcescens]|uniref:hypothetical protein n=1 Tax=Serratia marcescens TaxID=615 RepID=UPI001EF01E97|nr:hypothetical protein [Serratia marcescens]ULH12266.1 hypothetical protein MF265_05655 [Serratia marcescens]
MFDFDYGSSIEREIGRAVKQLANDGYVVCLSGILTQLAEERIAAHEHHRRRILTLAITSLVWT